MLGHNIKIVKVKFSLSFIWIIAAALILIGAVVNPGTSKAAIQLNPGDIVAADPSAPTDNGGIYLINPATGTSQVISSDGSFTEPTGIAIDANGDILIGDPQALGGGGAIFRINPTTGAQTTVSSGGYFVDPRGLAVAANGDIYVADSDAFNFYGGVIKVDPATGVQTPIYTSSDQNAGPLHLTIEANGNILISDVSAFGGLGGVIRLNPQTGVSTTVSSGGNINVPVGIAVAGNGDIYLANNSGSVIKINPVTGAQTPVASGYPLACPTGIAFDSSGNLLVGDPCQEPGAVIKINLATGAKTILASFGSSPQGIAVVPAPSPTPTPTPTPSPTPSPTPTPTPPAVLNLNIDIKPGNTPNSINPKSKGKIPVAILSSVGFDATTLIDRTSLKFGRSGFEASLNLCNRGGEDVNGDGLLDLVCHFNTPISGFQTGDNLGKLKGKTVNNTPAAGEDSVRIIP